MTPAEFDALHERFLTAWPRPKLDDRQVLLWREHWLPLDAGRVLNAIKVLETTKTTRPSIADFHTEYGPVKETTTTDSTRPPCGICDNGFVEIEPGLIPTVQRCPNGCLPRTDAERKMYELQNDRAWAQRRAREERGVRVPAMDFTEPRKRDHDDELDF